MASLNFIRECGLGVAILAMRHPPVGTITHWDASLLIATRIHASQPLGCSQLLLRFSAACNLFLCKRVPSSAPPLLPVSWRPHSIESSACFSDHVLPCTYYLQRVPHTMHHPCLSHTVPIRLMLLAIFSIKILSDSEFKSIRFRRCTLFQQRIPLRTHIYTCQPHTSTQSSRNTLSIVLYFSRIVSKMFHRHPCCFSHPQNSC